MYKKTQKYDQENSKVGTRKLRNYTRKLRGMNKKTQKYEQEN